MKKWFLYISLISYIALPQALAIAMGEVQKSDLEKVLGREETLPYEEEAPIRQAINAAGPEIIPLLTTVIHEHSNDPYFLIDAYNILRKKISPDDTSCRRIVLENIKYLTSDHEGLKFILVDLLGKCGKVEDAAPLLGVLQANDSIGLKEAAASSLARIGDADTLATMKKVYAEVAADEPNRFMRESNAWVKLFNKYNRTTNATWPKPRKSYLTNILERISELEQRVKTQAAAVSPTNEKKVAHQKNAINPPSSPNTVPARLSVPLAWVIGGILLGTATVTVLVLRYKSKRRMGSQSSKQR